MTYSPHSSPHGCCHVSPSSAAKVKNIRRGVKEVQKFINKGEKGWVAELCACSPHSAHLCGVPPDVPPGTCLRLCVCSIVVLAGDTLPIDVYCHLPIMCEDRNLPYAYIPSKVVGLRRWFLLARLGLFDLMDRFPHQLFPSRSQDLGSSAGSKRPTCVILIKPHDDYQDAYNEVLEEVSSLPKPLWANQRAAPLQDWCQHDVISPSRTCWWCCCCEDWSTGSFESLTGNDNTVVVTERRLNSVFSMELGLLLQVFVHFFSFWILFVFKVWMFLFLWSSCDT